MKQASLLLLLLVLGCESNQSTASGAPTPRDIRIAAADAFTGRYAHSRLSGWDIRASAAGVDCDVLFVRTSIILEDSLIEAMHYGAGAYDVYTGGVQQFCRDRTFRGVAYKDASEKVWTYGAVTIGEGESLQPCRKGA
jgi:hypothetical protein